MDPYAITPAERARFEAQFQSLKPVNGIVTGDQAKGLFLQSQLPPAVLGIIWALADTDVDGRMNINEFLIACKLISMKLRGFEIPKVLPPTLQALVTSPSRVNGVAKPPLPPSPVVGGKITPIAAVAPSLNRVISPPSGGGSPVMQPPLMSAGMGGVPIVPGQPVLPTAPMIPPQPLIPAQPIVPSKPMIPPQAAQPLLAGQTMIAQAQPMMPPVQPIVPSQPIIPVAQPMMPPTQPIMPGGPIMSAAQPIIPTNQPIIPSAQPIIPSAQPILPVAQPLGTVAQPIAAVPPNTLAGLNIAQPQTQTSALDKIPSLDSSSPLVEWAIPQTSRLKYTQLFNTTDRTRSGYLTGVQARNILMASQLPQVTLAKIWALADTDVDGKLSCEEFVLALHLCDMARRGESIPDKLPPTLVPPTTLRRTRNNSVSSDTGESGFNDKRKENFEKGQAELERRRKALLEIQKKEQEERERKEREEMERQEKLRLEQERKRQEEFERQVEMQKELERQKEEERLRQQQQREAARREMERQRQEEWEKQRIQELQSQRQKHQEAVLALKARNQALTIDLSTLSEKTSELSKKISDTRCKVTSVKGTIDGMRSTRDQEMASQARLKAQLKQLNQKLVELTKQKAKMESKEDKDAAAQAATKQLLITNLIEKTGQMQKEVDAKKEDADNNNTKAETAKNDLLELVEKCKALYSDYDVKRKKIIELRGDTKTTAASWGDDAWNSEPADWPETNSIDVAASSGKYRALYEFVARNGDELSFQPGDIITVSRDVNGEPGWLSGELRGLVGWFPESYVEPVDAAAAEDPNVTNANYQVKTPLEGIAEVSESEGEPPSMPIWTSPVLGQGQQICTTATVNFTFSPSADGMLLCTRGDILNISEIQDQWVYGECSGSSGWVPKSFVTLATPTTTTTTTVPAPVEGGEWYISSYAYQSEETGDLTFDQGQMILVTGKDGDWWTGTIGSNTGIFPSNYVQKAQQEEPVAAVEPVVPAAAVAPVTAAVSEPAPPEPTQLEISQPPTSSVSPVPSNASSTPQPGESSGAEDSDSKGGKTKKAEIATVIAPYQATSTEQLSLQRGQLIMIRKKTSTGWWEGELQAKGRRRQVGWFPAAYVKLLGGGSSSSQARSPVPTSASTAVDTNTERVVALYQYVAQNPDELSFEKDAIITVIAREEPAWWKGKLGDAVGLFPSNYVSPMSPTMENHLPNGTVMGKEEEKRQQYISELMDTEQAYVDDLSIVHDVFEKPMRESGLLEGNQIEDIFINWLDILECNYTFLRALRVRRQMNASTIQMIGDLLCERIPRMTVYIRYCSCQLSALTLLQSLVESKPELNALLRKCQADKRTHGLPLSSFLLKPMQRITRYPLLISKILEQTPKGHPDRQYLEEAHSRAEELCSQVNEGVREKENCERLEWLQSHVLSEGLSERLIFNSLTNSAGARKLLHYGVLTKVKSSKELIGFLMNDFLLLAQPNRSVGTQFNFDKHRSVLLRVYRSPCLLNQLVIVGEIGDGNELKLDYQNKLYHLSCPNNNEKNLWLSKLSSAIKDFSLCEKNKFHRQQSKEAKLGACGRVLVVIVSGRHLKFTAAGLREVFCEVCMGSQERRTPAVTAAPDPVWNESMQFLVKDLKHDVLCFTVKDKGHFSPDTFLGRGELRVSDLLTASRLPGPLVTSIKLHQVNSGEITIKLDLRLFNK